MIQVTVRSRASRTAIHQAIAQVGRGLRGSSPVAQVIMTRAGMALLGRIRTAFITKARGGIDEAGERWQPLSPRTIAYSRRTGRTKTERGRPSRPSQALNKKQQDRWWEVYRRQLARFEGDKRHAAAYAWVVLKAEGAVTLLEKYGHRYVEILRDTGLLLNSLSPGVPSAERVFRVGPGTVTVGTNRKGAIYHHRGIPGRLPQRRLWPLPRRWPSNWWKDITDQIVQGMVDMAIVLLRGTT